MRKLLRTTSVLLFCLLMVVGARGSGQEPVIIDGQPKALADLDIEQLLNVRIERVVGASKYEQKVTQAPASVSIVTADEIKKFGYRTLADVLRGTRGFYVANDRNYSYLGSRGFQRPGDYNTRYLFLIDGHRMNDNIYDSAWIGTDGFLDIDLVDRVEVVRGPSSSIYGNSAFLGVINIVTKSGRQFNGAEGSVEVGSFDTYKGRFTAGKKFTNDVEWMASGTYYTSAGQPSLYYPEFDQRISADPRARNDGMSRNSDGEKSYQFFTSATYHDFTLTGLYSSRKKDVPTAPFGTFFGEQPTQTRDERAYVELKYHHEFGDHAELTARISYDAYPYVGKYPYDYVGNNSPADVVINRDEAFGDWMTSEVQWKQRIFDRHTVVAGIEHREDLHQQQRNYDEVGPLYIDDQRTGRSLGAYGQMEAVLRTNLLLNVGLRYDYYSTFGSTLNPRVGLIYSPFEKTTFKLLYGQAYRAPNNYELYYGAGTPFAPNPNLQPETIQTYEVIYEQYLPANLRLNASGYHYEIDKLISQTPIPGTAFFQFQNVDRVTANGLVFELEGKYAGGLLARVGYVVQRTEDAMTGAELTSSPRHIAKGNLIVPVYQEKIFAALELQYQSGIRTLAGARSKQHVLANFTLFGKELAKGLEVSASIYNLFDTKYSSPGASDHLQDTIAQDGRAFRVKLTYRF